MHQQQKQQQQQLISSFLAGRIPLERASLEKPACKSCPVAGVKAMPATG